MPFPKQDPRPFTKAGIEWLGPNQNGCYGIFRSGQWIYVGKGDLRTRLLAHLNGNGGSPCILKQAPTHYMTVLSTDMDNLEKQLILELSPVCNQKVG